MTAYDNMKGSVLRISYIDQHQAVQWGTCFPVLVKGHPAFATAAHIFTVVERPHQYELSFCSPRHAIRTSKMTIDYIGCDIAIIRECWFKTDECLPFDDGFAPEMGRSMFVAVGYPRTGDGFPGCTMQEEMRGIIDKEMRFRECSALHLNTSRENVGPGMSGAPVFNMNDDLQGVRVIGMVNGTNNDPKLSHDIVAVRIKNITTNREAG